MFFCEKGLRGYSDKLLRRIKFSLMGVMDTSSPARVNTSFFRKTLYSSGGCAGHRGACVSAIVMVRVCLSVLGWRAAYICISLPHLWR